LLSFITPRLNPPIALMAALLLHCCLMADPSCLSPFPLYSSVTELFATSQAPLPTRLVRVALERAIEWTGQASRKPGPAPAAKHRAIDGTLTYGLSDDQHVGVGQRVMVPLGRTNQLAGGVVLEVGPASDERLLGGASIHKIKPVAKILPAVLTPLVLKLGVWMSDYYIAPIGMTLSALLPSAVKNQTGRKAKVLISLAENLASLPPPTGSARLVAAWNKLLALDSDAWPMTAKALLKWAPGVGQASIKNLIEQGYLTASVQEEVVAAVDPFAGLDVKAGTHTGRLELTTDQQRAVDGITSTLGNFSVHVLHGVTGSGKTEVYLACIEKLLEQPSASPLSAIMLVPEIALTPQTAQRFLSRFGSRVAVLHSGLTASQRHVQWTACSQGKVDVVVGARSAIFAPLAKVGLIIVDEEHDTSYKQDQVPRYHGRDVAIKRAQLEACPIVLGSATPSLESWFNAVGLPEEFAREAGSTATGSPAISRGKYHLHSMPNRVGGAKLPAVKIVDLADERRNRALVQPAGYRDRHLHLIGPTLEQAIGDTLLAGGQVMLLLNRRGYANYICCTDPKCGWIMQCDHCDVTTVYHVDRRLRTGGYVRCHHCLTELLLPRACPQCSKAINTFGLGTQRVEAELERKFGPAHGLVMGQTLLRLDSDSMQSAKEYFAALSRFGAGHVRVLVGTQMIAKGLDYPNVRLVGVISADTSLHLPDFRASERTFQLVAQVAGRSGRGEKPGQVIVQTASPGEPAIVLASKHDFVRFATLEIGHRYAAGHPPISRMARIVCRDLDLEAAQDAARSLAKVLADRAGPMGVSVRGPAPCPIARIGDHHRLQIELVASNRTAIQNLLGQVRAEGLLISDQHTAVDVDPIALL
jgi:primosomal protein N' (replication factor Y) (superfamily II helicase)